MWTAPRSAPISTPQGQKKASETVASDEALGRSRGGFTTRIHLRAEGGGKLLTFLLTAGQRHEAAFFVPLMEQGAVKRAGRGRPRQRPKRVVGDKGYSTGPIRTYCRHCCFRITIPRKQNERRRDPFNRTLYRQRNCVERLINPLKQFRRIATCYEKRVVNYAAMLTLAAILLWV
jgi:transposase